MRSGLSLIVNQNLTGNPRNLHAIIAKASLWYSLPRDQNHPDRKDMGIRDRSAPN
jgi:hypothetical protein